MKNREIKFRVWNGVEWAEHIYVGEEVCGHLYGTREDLVFQQFTGLLDKNGKEIYEGDLVRFKWLNPAEEVEETTGEVWWDEEMAMFSFDRSFKFAMNDSCFIEETLEVVGNVFEEVVK